MLIRAYSGRKCVSGLTLFELLVVLSVIFVLIIIMLLSYNHLLITTKISRVKEEHIMVVRALNNYHIDYATFPASFQGLSVLSAPTAYLGAVPLDPFSPENKDHPYYYIENPTHDIAYIIISRGPDMDNDLIEMFNKLSVSYSGSQANSYSLFEEILDSYFIEKIYDPTNGVISDGDIIYIGKK